MQNRGPVPDGPIGCPVDRESRKWLERAVYWMGSQFGTEVCYRDPVLPVAGFLSAASYCASPEGIEALVTRNLKIDVDTGTVSADVSLRFEPL